MAAILYRLRTIITTHQVERNRVIFLSLLLVPNSLSVNRDHTGVPPQQNFNFTLTCSLTCADACDKNMNLTCSHSAGGHQGASSVVQVNNTLISQLFVPELRVSERLACIVLREGAEKARQERAVKLTCSVCHPGFLTSYISNVLEHRAKTTKSVSLCKYFCN